MPVVNLKNITIKKLEDRNFNTYYLIVNNDNQDEVFFCFEKAVKGGWIDLVNNWEKVKKSRDGVWGKRKQFQELQESG